MMSGPSPHITELLLAWNKGEDQALDRLMPLVQDELHRLAHGGTIQVALDEAAVIAHEPSADLVALDEALKALACSSET
jgi:hypothetical protein